MDSSTAATILLGCQKERTCCSRRRAPLTLPASNYERETRKEGAGCFQHALWTTKGVPETENEAPNAGRRVPGAAKTGGVLSTAARCTAAERLEGAAIQPCVLANPLLSRPGPGRLPN